MALGRCPAMIRMVSYFLEDVNGFLLPCCRACVRAQERYPAAAMDSGAAESIVLVLGLAVT